VACGAALNAATALQAMTAGPQCDVGAVAFEARAQTSPRALPLPVCLLHGEQDRIVAEQNSTALLRQFLVFNGRSKPEADGLPQPDAQSVTKLGNGRAMTREDYVLGGRVVARNIRVPALGHAWSGGDEAFAYNDPQPPDATSLFGEFFAAHIGRHILPLGR
jgi:hypothetical protein